VRKCWSRENGTVFAVKIIDKESVSKQFWTKVVQRELEILSLLAHDHIVRMTEYFQEETKLYMVLELVTGGELFDYILNNGAYSERDACYLAKQVAEAMVYMHRRGIVHRDMKPENVLLSEQELKAEIKVSDFGLATYYKDGQPKLEGLMGTPGFIAPEMIKRQGYTTQVDLWAVGMIMYVMLAGNYPWDDETIDTLTYSNIDPPFCEPEWDSVSPEAKDLVAGLLKRDPEERYTAAEFLAHPWMRVGMEKTAPLQGMPDKILQFQARKKLKRAMNAAMAVAKMKRFAAAALSKKKTENSS